MPIDFCKLVSLRYEVQQVFAKGAGVERVFFPDRSIELPNRPALTFAIHAPEQVFEDRDETWRMVEFMTKEHGASARTFKSALIWCVPDVNNAIRNEARKVLAWKDIQYEADDLGFDERQKRELPENLRRAQRGLRESVWRAYKNVPGYADTTYTRYRIRISDYRPSTHSGE